MRKCLAYSLGFVFVAKILVTGNILMALLSTLTLSMIVVNVLAICLYAGWELGPTESAAIAVCLGLSTTYLVIFSDRYVQSEHPDRSNRAR